MTGLTEMHCHIIPGVDDGASTMDEVRALLKMEYKQGVRTIILTPHFRKGMFEVSAAEIRKQMKKVQRAAEQLNLDIEFFLGREFYADSHLSERLRSEDCLTLAGTKYILVEFSYSQTFQKIRSRVYELMAEGYIPVIAHIERYACLTANIDLVEELVDMGAHMQVNASPVIGEDGLRQKRFCAKLMKRDLIYFIGTDAHDSRSRIPNLGRCAEYIEKKMGSDYAKKILIDHPRMLLKKVRRDK